MALFALVRTDADQSTTRSPSTATRPARSASSRARGASAARQSGRRPGRRRGRVSRASRAGNRPRSGAGGPPPRSGQKAEKVVPEHLPHSGRRVAGALERRPKKGRAVRGIIEEQGQVLILSESLPNAPLPRACGRWGSWPDSGSWNRSGSTTSRSTCPTWTKASPSTPTCSGVPSARTVPISPSAARGSIWVPNSCTSSKPTSRPISVSTSPSESTISTASWTNCARRGSSWRIQSGSGANRQTFLNDPAGNVVELHEVGVSTPG